MTNPKPLCNPEAEQAVLAAVIRDNGILTKIPNLAPGDFYVSNHQRIFEAMLSLWAEGTSVDALTVQDRLESLGKAEGVPQGYLASLKANGTPGPDAAKIVKRLSLSRHLSVALGELQDRLDRGEDPGRVAAEAAELAALECESGPEVVYQAELIDAAHAEFEGIQNGKLAGTVPIGFKSLARCDPRPGTVVVVGADAGSYKTEFALEWATNAARLNPPLSTLFVSAEMPLVDCAWREASRESLVPVENFRTLGMNLQERVLVNGAFKKLRGLPILWSPVNKVQRVIGIARRLAEQGAIKLLMIDYLQLMNAQAAENRNLEIQGASAGFKALAKSTGLVVVLLSQLSRYHLREGRAPNLGDLRESGSIGQDADLVLLLSREKGSEVLQVLIEKQRNGRRGLVRLRSTRGHIFDDMAQEE